MTVRTRFAPAQPASCTSAAGEKTRYDGRCRGRTEPEPADFVEGFRERAETLLHMAASGRYCYEDFEVIEPKSAKKHLRPVILEPLRAARERLAATMPSLRAKRRNFLN